MSMIHYSLRHFEGEENNLVDVDDGKLCGVKDGWGSLDWIAVTCPECLKLKPQEATNE